MPLYIDIHKNVKGVTPEKLAEAHRKDLEVQDKHGVKYLKYWYNEGEGTVFCLCEAPNKGRGDRGEGRRVASQEPARWQDTFN